ncbi:MAG: DUF1648 domain-containing protein [Pseudolabrys sp.]
MNRTSLVIFVSLLVIFTFLSINSIGDLPDKIAIHFDVSGSADSWTTREVYRVVFLICLIGFPLFLVSVMSAAPRHAKGKAQSPGHENRSADGGQKQIEDPFWLRHACWLGALTVVFIYGIHIVVIRANAMNPPTLAISQLLLMVFIYLAALAWWIAVFLRHYKKQTG